MQKMMMTIVALVLAFSLAGPAWTADALTGLKDRGAPAAGKQQIACPVQGGKIHKDLYADYQGQRVYFCCPACIGIFKKDPEKYLEKMKREGVTPEKAPAGN